MNDREAFKFGFMSKCIEQGFTTPEEMLGQAKTACAVMEKNALAPATTILGLDALKETGKGMFDAAGHIGSTALSWGIPLALAAPPVIGAAGGMLAAKARDIDDTDVDDAKKDELIDTYQQEADKLRRQGMLRRQQASAPRPRALF